MARTSDPSGSLVISYLGLRRAIGLVATALPFALVLGKLLLDGPGLPGSMSAYYHTSCGVCRAILPCATTPPSSGSRR